MKGFKKYRKKTGEIVMACRMHNPFVVRGDSGMLSGLGGDYLVVTDSGDEYPVTWECFEQEYSEVKEKVIGFEDWPLRDSPEVA